MQTQTTLTTESTQPVSTELMRKVHMIGAVIPAPRRTITEEQMHKIHAVGGYVPQGTIVI